MLVWLPADALRDSIGDLPDEVRLVGVPRDGEDLPADLAVQVGDVDYFVLAPWLRGRLAELLPRLTSLRVVQTLNAGVDWVPELPGGVLLCNGSGIHDGPVAEWVLAVTLAMQKRLPHFLSFAARGEWDHTANLAFADGIAARDIAGSRVLIVGMGSIGRAVGERFAAFGADVVGVARHPRDGVPGPDALPDLLPEADVVVLLAPATPETAGLVDTDFLARMKLGALLVNGARGSLVDHDALLDAVREERVRAALDATDPEPLPAEHPLWQAPGVLITPHVAGSSDHWLVRSYEFLGDQIRRVAAGEQPLNVRRYGY